MTIEPISVTEAIRRVGHSLQIPSPAGLTIPVICQALRRAMNILAPCPRHELERAVVKSLAGLDTDEALEMMVEEATESLLVFGDILEMRPIDTDAWQDAALILRPSPPSFVVRGDHSVVLVGVAGDEITPLVGELRTQIEYRASLRVLKAPPTEDLRTSLKDLGLMELTEATWLRLPPPESAEAYVSKWREDLAASPVQRADIDGLRVLAPSKGSSFYRDRWIGPDESLNGTFVARRSQRYGKDVWCLVELAQGRPQRLLDLFSVGDRLRPCDIAWRIQMAIDATAGRPQQFRIRRLDSSCFVDFLSPLPSWAERKLLVLGEKAEPFKAITTFVLETQQLNEAVEFLRRRLWLSPTEQAEATR